MAFLLSLAFLVSGGIVLMVLTKKFKFSRRESSYKLYNLIKGLWLDQLSLLGLGMQYVDFYPVIDKKPKNPPPLI